MIHGISQRTGGHSVLSSIVWWRHDTSRPWQQKFKACLAPSVHPQRLRTQSAVPGFLFGGYNFGLRASRVLSCICSILLYFTNGRSNNPITTSNTLRDRINAPVLSVSSTEPRSFRALSRQQHPKRKSFLDTTTPPTLRTHQRVGPILMEETHRGNTARLHSVQIGQELQVFLQGLATGDRAQDLALSNTLDTVSKNLAHSRTYRLVCSTF